MRPEDWELHGARAVQMLVRARHGGVAGLLVFNGSMRDLEFRIPHLRESLFTDEDPGAQAAEAEGHSPERTVEFVFSTDAGLRSQYGRRISGGQTLQLPAMTVGALSFD